MHMAMHVNSDDLQRYSAHVNYYLGSIFEHLHHLKWNLVLDWV